jgi:hypothetical protein
MMKTADPLVDEILSGLAQSRGIRNPCGGKDKQIVTFPKKSVFPDFPYWEFEGSYIESCFEEEDLPLPEVVERLTCDRCGHIWRPRYAKLPKVCPQCKRTDWNDGSKRRDLSDANG